MYVERLWRRFPRMGLKRIGPVRELKLKNAKERVIHPLFFAAVFRGNQLRIDLDAVRLLRDASFSGRLWHYRNAGVRRHWPSLVLLPLERVQRRHSRFREGCHL